MRTRNKILMGIAIAIGILIIAAGIALFVISRDEAPPDDSDLIVKRLDIPDDQNGFTYFQQAGAALYWPGTEAWKKAAKHSESEDAEKIKDRLERMMDGKDWDAVLAAEVLDANKPTFALIEKGLACREFQVPKPVGMDALDLNVLDFLNLSRACFVRAFAMAKAGDKARAVDEALRMVQFGHALERSKGVLVTCLVGTTIKGMGLATVRQLVANGVLPPEHLKKAAARLVEFADSGEGYADSLRVEYGWGMGIIEEFREGKGVMAKILAQMQQSGRTEDDVKRDWESYMNFGLVFKPNQTRRFYIETIQPTVENATKHFADMHPPPDVRVELKRRPWYLSGNVVGKKFIVMFLPAVPGAMQLKVRVNDDVAVTRILLALKAFKLATGRLPKTLDELVPEYLAAVPLDDFDGKPLRYSPEKKILYSVGKDLKDEGGSTKEETLKWWQKENPSRPPEDAQLEPPLWDLPNPSWPIEF